MPYLKQISSCPLVWSKDSGLWVPDEKKTVYEKPIFTGRRKFLKLAGIGAAGLTGAVMLNSLLPKKAEAQWYQLIPVLLAAMQIINTGREWSNDLGLTASLDNQSDYPQTGGFGLKLLSYYDEPIYRDTSFIDYVPARTRRNYQFGKLPCGPSGRNVAQGYTGYNSLSRYYNI